MRVNKTTSLALAAALTVGGAGAATAAFAAGPQPASSTVQAPSPLPGTGDIAAQNELLTHTAGVLDPVTELIDAVLQAPEGKLPAAAAKKHSAAVRAALGKVRQSAVAGGTVGRAAPAPAAAPVDIVAKTAAELQEQADELIKASAPAFRTAAAQANAKTAADERPGDVKKVREELKSTVSATVDLLAAVVLSGQLPAPDLAGLPERPADSADQGDEASSAAGLPDIAGIPG